MAYDTDGSGYRKTTRVKLDSGERFYVRDANEWFPTTVEGGGLQFTNVSDMKISNLDIDDVMDTGGYGDCLRLQECSDMTFNNCNLRGHNDEAIDIEDCTGTITFNDCTFGPAHLDQFVDGGHDYTALIQDSGHVVFNNCTFTGESRNPAIYNTIVTLNNCSLNFGFDCIEIRGPGALVNVTGTTTFTNIAGWDTTVRYPARTPFRIWEVGSNDFERPCIYLERQKNNWTNETDHIEESWVTVVTGTEADKTLLFSATPFALA